MVSGLGSKRSLLLSAAAAAASLSLNALSPGRASASLAQFPASELNIRYFLVRAGESVSEAEGITSTNPAFKTAMRNGLSPAGREQVKNESLQTLFSQRACDDGCWLWTSITNNSYQTAELLATGLLLGRSRIVPEFSFLDSRGVGALEGFEQAKAQAQLSQGDALDPSGGRSEVGAHVLRVQGYDGTPNESLVDVLVRVRQVMSVTETQYSQEDVLIITPDSLPLSVLQAAVLGVDLRQHSRYAFRAGEVRPLQLSSIPPTYAPFQMTCSSPPNC
ncbi:MAG: hypothetical protein WDW36_009156 [Sanguina aurantia]